MNKENGRVAFLSDVAERVKYRSERKQNEPVRINPKALAGLQDDHARRMSEVLAGHAAHLAREQRHLLEEEMEKGRRLIARPDFLWYVLLQSFATMGNSRGAAKLLDDDAVYTMVEHKNLVGLPTATRAERITKAVERAGLRFPEKKIKYMLSAWERIESLGGLQKAQQMLLKAGDGQTMLRFLDAFYGIAEKFSRNIMMDLAHPDTMSYIAIDDRIKKISSVAKLTFAGYADHEQFYLMAAKAAGLTGWELDRLMYNFRDDFIEAVKRAA